VRHGTPSAYNHGCRCPDCREANRIRCLDQRERLRQRTIQADPAVPHGTTGGYKNWGCHCVKCTIANTISSRDYYHASKIHPDAVATTASEA
jgi:hypothetical protein